MASTLGGWYLNGTTLQLRAYKEGTTELSTTVLASINGLTNIKVKGGTGNDKNNVLVKNTSGDWEAIADTDVVVTEETTDFLKKGNGPWEKVGETELVEGADGVSKKTTAKTKFVISSGLLGSSNISVSGSADYAVTMDLSVADKVHIDGTETITYNSSAGNATIIGDLTAGFTLNKLDGTATSATYNSAKTNQTLATITGLQRGYTASTEQNAVTTVDFEESHRDLDGVVTAGYITLSKVSDVTYTDEDNTKKPAPAGTVSALGTSNISVNNQTIATNNGINYYLKLGGIAGDYVQKNTTDEAAYWTVKGTTATYQYYSPTGYQLTDSSNKIIDNTAADYSTNQTKATKIKVTAAKTTTVVTVTGLAQNLTTNATDTKIAEAKSSVANTRSNSIADQVGSGQARTGTSADATFVPGITVTSGPSGTSNKPTYKTGTTTLDTNVTNNGKGSVEINITRSVLPASGTVTVTPGSAFTATVTTDTTAGTNDFYTNADKDDTTKVKNQRIWVINGNTATYKEVDLAYYEVQNPVNGVTKIVCKAQTGGTTLATIRGLNEDWLANEENLTRNSKDTTVGGGVITAIKGITFTKPAGYDYDTNGKPKAKTSEVGEITLSSEVLAGMNVTIGGSDNFKLALLANGDNTSGKTNVALPTFSNYKWNLNNTTATLKGDITAGYWAADNGKAINYTATAKNQTLASVSGLKSGTQLNSENDIRTIGNYTSTSASGEYENFESGVTINATKALEHKTEAGSKTLTRIPITISKHVLGTSQVNLTSNFFTLALDKDATGLSDLTAKDASPTYVFEKGELYTTTTDSSTGKTTDTPNTGADAIVGWHGSLGSTSTLKQSTPAYYTLGDKDAAGTVKKITYTKPGTATTVATVKGLNSAITENDIAFDTENHVITIKTANALTTSNVTIEMPKATTANPNPPQYTLALESGVDALGEATLSDKTWKQSGTTLSYTAKVTGAGYKLNKDANIITYTKEATSTPTTLATITGIRAGLVTDTTGVTDPSTDNKTKFSDIPGVTFDPKAGTVTLTKAALNNANVKLSGSGNYKLLINKKVDKTDATGEKLIDATGEDLIVTKKPDAKKVWVISGSTATYRLVTPEYYEYDPTANSLTYVKPANAKYQKTDPNNTDTYDTTKTGDIPALGQIKGLKSNLVVSADGQTIGYYNDAGTFVGAIKFAGTSGDNAKKIIITDDYVLNNANVTLDNAALNAGYSIALDTTNNITKTVDGNEKTKTLDQWVRPEAIGTPEWTINRGTATYKGNISAGYANDGKGITYSAAKNNTEIAKITGLDTTLTTLPANTGLQVGTDSNANVITVYNDVLTDKDVKLTTTVKLTGSDYKLVLGTGDKAVKSTYEESETHKGWTVSGTTATYGTWTPTYYTLNSGTQEAPGPSDTITYNGEGFLAGNQIATVSGLASGLVTIKDDQIRGIVLGSTTTTGDGADAVTTFTEDRDQPKATGKIIKLSANVLPTSPKKDDKITVTMKDSQTGYTLELDDDLKPQTTTAYKIENYTPTTSKLTINDMLTAGYTADTDKTTFTYAESKNAGEGIFATIMGLNKDIKLNSEGTIDSIKVSRADNDKTITLFKGALTDKEVNITSERGYTLKLATADDVKDDYASQKVPPASTNGQFGWKATSTKGKFELYAGISTSGYTLSNDGKSITYSAGRGFDSTGQVPVATIEGLNTNITLTGTSLADAGVVVSNDGATITISKQALGGKEVKVIPSDTTSTNYKLKLNDTTGDDGYVAASERTSTWSINKGTATYKEEITEGYALDTDDETGRTIKYTPKGTITTTLTNLSQENLTATAVDPTTKANKLVTAYTPTNTVSDDQGGTTTETVNYGIEFDNGVFTVTDSDALAHKDVKLTTQVSGTGLTNPGYKLALGFDKDLKDSSGNFVPIKATVKNPVWVKSNTSTTATYTQETSSGYSLSGDEKNIVYSNDPKFVDLATVSNLKKDVELNSDGKIVTTAADGTKSTADTASIEKVTDPSDNGSGTTTDGTIKVDKALFDGKNVTLKNTDKYVFTDDSVENKPSSESIWTISGSTATYKNVTPAYYSFTQANGADNKRSIKYNAQADYKGEDGTTAAELTKITGLKSGVKLDSEGYVLDSTGAREKDANGSDIQGLNVIGESSVALSAAVLGTSDITSTAYTLSLTDNVTKKATDVVEWVGNGTTYTNKKYTKAYYTCDSDKKVTYKAAKDIETYATITGLAKDLIASGATPDQAATLVGAGPADADGYTTITLGATQLKGVTSNVKLTTANGGKFKLALNTDTASGGVTESKITPADAWTTSGTTATLKGFKSAGYTLNDSGDTITYQKEGTKGTDGKQTEVTVATVKGLKSGATITDSDVTTVTEGTDAGTKIITLKLAQLGTSNVTLTGDGYKLAVADDVKSGNDDPKWVKTTTATKATYSQNNHNGFTASADGKTLTYWKNKSNNVDLVTINGLAKTFDQSKMAVVSDTDGTTIVEGALVVLNTANKTVTLKKEALGSNKITIGNNDGYTLQIAGATDGKIGGDNADKDLVLNNGTLSIVSGTNESWEVASDGKSLNYTAAKYDTYATVSGLPKDKTVNELVTVNGEQISVKAAALPTNNNGNITLSNKTVSGTRSNYTLALEDTSTATPSTTVNKKQWALSGTTLTLKGYKSGGYTTANTNDGMKITYIADTGYTDLASIKFTGVANNFLKLVNGKIYLSTDETMNLPNGIVTFDNSMEVKTVGLSDTLLEAIRTEGNAATIAITGNGNYSFDSLSGLGNTSETADPTFTSNSFSTAGKAVLQKETTAGWTIDNNDTPKTIKYVKQSFASAGTINGISKTYDSTMHSLVGASNLDLTNPAADADATVKGTITIGAEALTNSNVTFSKVSGGYDYDLVLADNIPGEDDWKNKTDWVNNNGTANYKTYDDEHWVKAATGNQITYIKPTSGKSYANISGLSKTASIKKTNGEDNDVGEDGTITLHAEDLGTSKVTLNITKVASLTSAANAADSIRAANDALNPLIANGNTTAADFKLALHSDVSLLSGVEDAVWDNNGTVATLTGTIKKGYKLSNDQKSVTYQATDKKLQQIAKVSGIKKDSQITDDDVKEKKVNDNLTVQEISLTADHLGTSNVVLTGEGYKLALGSDVLVSTFTTETVTDENNVETQVQVENKSAWENKTEWFANGGTFTYKTYDKAHYKLNDAGTQVQYFAAKDDSSKVATITIDNVETTVKAHQTYAQITGLSRTATAEDIATIITGSGEDTVSLDNNITDTASGNTVANSGVISLTSGLLNKTAIKLTDSQVSGYTLNFGLVDDSLKSTVSNFNASVSGTGANLKAAWVGTQGKGYLLKNDLQSVDYYSAAKTNQTFAQVTGLASTVTSDNNDAFSAAYTADTNVVSLGAASLGSSVTVSGTAAFDLGDSNYKDAQIVGSGSADKLTVSGSNLSINAGGGNDIVDLTSASGSTFLYANGNGNDIIKGIGSNTIKITNVASTNITVQTDTKNTADTIVKVNNGTIRVKGVISGVSVIDKDGETVSYTDPANVLADDNYAITPQNTSADEDYAMSPNLSSIVKGATSSYTADDLATDDATSLAKQSTAVSYSGKK